MRKLLVLTAVLAGISTAAYAADASLVTSLLASCCDSVAECCKQVIACCK